MLTKVQHEVLSYIHSNRHVGRTEVLNHFDPKHRINEIHDTLIMLQKSGYLDRNHRVTPDGLQALQEFDDAKKQARNDKAQKRNEKVFQIGIIVFTIVLEQIIIHWEDILTFLGFPFK